MNSILKQISEPINNFSNALEFLYILGFRGRDFMRACEPAMRRLLMEKDFLPDFAATGTNKFGLKWSIIQIYN